jgi:ligand-binding sensor domain-containing protein
MHRRRHIVLLLAFLTGVLPPASARATGAWSTYSRMQTCRAILALGDSVWFATGEAGLMRYRRSLARFDFINREPGGLASNNLTALTYDRSGRLWVGTAGKGVSRLSASGGSWDLLNAFDGLPSDSITVLRAVGDTVWIGTTRGIALWDGRQIAGSVPDLGTPSPFASNLVTGIVEHGDSLFIATADGINVARPSEHLKKWSTANAGLGGTNVLSLCTDGRDLIALAPAGICRWDAIGGTWANVTGFGCPMAIRDDGRLVTGWSNLGLYSWIGSNWVLHTGSPGGNCSTVDLEYSTDPAGSVFASRNGLVIDEAGGGWNTLEPPGPVGNNVQNVLADGGRVWVATYSDGISRWNGASWHNWPPGCCGLGQDSSFTGPSFAFMLQRDLQGRLWAANWETAIERIDESAFPVLQFEHPFLAVGVAREDTLARHSDGWSCAIDSLGYVYVGGDTPDRGVLEPMGIDVYDPSGAAVINWRSTSTGLASNQVRGLAVDSRGTIWAGMASGGVAYTAVSSLASSATGPNDHRKLPAFTPIVALNGADIFGVVAYGDSIWVLTTSDLKRVRATTRTVQSALDIPAGPAPRGAVHPLAVSPDGTVWVGSVDGVRMYRPGGGFSDFRIDNSPLADNEVRAISIDPVTGVAWIGTATGINRFDPHYQPPPPPRIPSLAFKLYPNPVSLTAFGTQLRLSGNTSSYSGEILDLGGRVVREFGGVADGAVIWDGRDSDGGLVRPGIYFVHARAGGHEGLKRVVVLR